MKVHNTPTYIYTLSTITDAVQAVRDAFPKQSIIYSLKTNPYAPIVQHLRGLGVGMDAASKNEVLSAARLGHTDIYYSAPGKKRADIEATLDRAHIIADSVNEIRLLSDIAKARGRGVLNIGVRLNLPNPAMENSNFEVMSGVASKFGVTLEDLLALIPQLPEMQLCVDGLHVYFGSQLLDAAWIASNFSVISKAALQVHAVSPLAYINYGGGFGVPYEDSESPLDLHAIARRCAADADFQAVQAADIRMNIELGRFLVAEAGQFVCRVVDIKQSGDTQFVILDGGMHSFFRPKFTGQTHKVEVFDKTYCPVGNKFVDVRLVGNTCTPLDVFYENSRLPQPSIGDFVVFANAGAYGYSMSMLDFISFDRPEQEVRA